MFDFSTIFRSLAALAEGRALTVASTYPLPMSVVASFRSIGGFSGWIAEEAPRTAIDGISRGEAAGTAAGNRLVAGWWTDRDRGRWHLIPSRGGVIALIGAQPGDGVSGQMQLEALLNGYDRIVLVDAQGHVVVSIDCYEAVARSIDAAATGYRNGGATYDRAIDAMCEELGGMLKLPREALVAGRVLILVGSLGPGGAERQVAYTAIGLAKRGVDVWIACNHLSPPGDFFKAAVEEAGVKVVQVPSMAPDFETPEMLAARSRMSRYDFLMFNWGVMYSIFHYALVIREVRPSVLHTWMDYASTLGGLAGHLVGIPALVAGGRSVAPDHFPALYQPYMRPCYVGLSARRTVEYVNNSAAGARDYERWLDLAAQSIDVIHNGFDFPDTLARVGRAELRERYGIGADALVVGTISRLSEEKNPQLFVEMAKVILERRPDTHFLVFGHGPLAESLRHLAELYGIAARLHLCGLAPSPWPALAAMDISVLTSRAEGLSNVLVESQAAGLPVVCTGVGGMPETYVEGETGFGVRAATGQALAEVVLRLLDDEALRTRMGEAAHAHARANFDIDVMIERTMQVYDKALAGAGVTSAPLLRRAS